MALSCSKKLSGLNFLRPFETENKIEYHEKVCKNKYFCGTVMSSEKDSILEFNQYMETDKMPCIIYVDTESLIEKIVGCANNPKNYSTKIDDHAYCGYLMSTIWVLIK